MNTQIKNGKTNQTFEDKVKKVAAVPAKLHQFGHADLLMTVHYTYDRGTCKASDVRITLEQEGWGIRSISYDPNRDVDITIGTLGIHFSIDFSIVIGLEKVGWNGLEIPLPTVNKLFTVYGDVDSVTTRGFANVYPRGY